MEKQKILIPLDGTDVSRKILAPVCDFFSPDRYEILILRADQVPSNQFNLRSIVSRPVIMSGDLGVYGAVATRAQVPEHQDLIQDRGWNPFKEQLREELKADTAELESKGYVVSIAVHFGKPAEEIVELAKYENVALVAMASHGRAGVKKLLKGSVTEDVLHHLSVPLMVINVAEI